MMAICKNCKTKHDATMTICVNRFSSEPHKYKATYEGAPMRATRKEAEEDACAYRAS